jgi:hypothetical protein
LHVDQNQSSEITEKINQGDLSCKPGWLRFSIHPVMTDKEVDIILNAIRELAYGHCEWTKDYKNNTQTKEYIHKEEDPCEMKKMIENWFDLAQ